MPVVDLAAVIGMARSESISRWVILRLGDRRLALAVDSVIGIRELEASTLPSLPPLLRNVNRGLVESIGTLDSELLMLLEAGRILPEGIRDFLMKEGEGACR